MDVSASSRLKRNAPGRFCSSPTPVLRLSYNPGQSCPRKVGVCLWITMPMPCRLRCTEGGQEMNSSENEDFFLIFSGFLVQPAPCYPQSIWPQATSFSRTDRRARNHSGPIIDRHRARSDLPTTYRALTDHLRTQPPLFQGQARFILFEGRQPGRCRHF